MLFSVIMLLTAAFYQMIKSNRVQFYKQEKLKNIMQNKNKIFEKIIQKQCLIINIEKDKNDDSKIKVDY